jgi:uncharacterized membrane protein YgdD (TMEM256/DUF423 family)
MIWNLGESQNEEPRASASGEDWKLSKSPLADARGSSAMASSRVTNNCRIAILKCDMTNSPNKTFLVIGAIFGLFAVLIGAFGAHSISEMVTPEILQVYETGVRYQFYHAFALLILGIIGNRCPARLATWAGGLFSFGIVLFSGSLYLITAIYAANMAVPLAVGLLTPLGGLLLICGWATFLAAILKMEA